MKKRNYSYNCGRPIEKVVVPTMAEVINLFDKLRASKQVFRVDFLKRTTGEMRTMVCMFGVTKHLKGGKKAYDAGDKGLFTVWSFDRQGYRSITIDNIRCVKTGGTLYYFDVPEIFKGKKYEADLLEREGIRTIPAQTSPLLRNMPA